MKAICMVVLLMFGSFAQSTIFCQTLPVPEFTSRPYLLLPDSTLQDLERADAKLDIKVKGMGYGGSETYYTAFQPKSTVRFPHGSIPRIVIKFDSNVDPTEKITLVKATVKSDRRRFLMGSRSLYGKVRDVSKAQVVVAFKKIGDRYYELQFPNGLEAGEYAIMPMMDANSNNYLTGGTMKITCFGIDE